MWKTSDLALATYLIMTLPKSDYLGHEWNDKTCHWKFSDEGDLIPEIARFTGGEALVDPSAFYANLNTTRREMYNEIPPRKAAPAATTSES